MDNNIVVFDLEADGLYFDAKKIWTIHALHRGTGERLQISPYKDDGAKKKLMDFFFQKGCPTIVGHNILGYDMFVLRKLLDIDFQVGKKGSDWLMGKQVRFIDTYFMSMFLSPDRHSGHSLASWGERLNFPKMDYREELVALGVLDAGAAKGEEFSFYHKLMEVYCKQDVAVTERVFHTLMAEAEKMYGDDSWKKSFIAGQKSFYLMNIQELSGWPFDIEKAKALQERVEKMMADIEAEIEPQLPLRPLKKSEEAFYTMPAKPFKKDGSLSSHMLVFIERHHAERIGEYQIKIRGKTYEIAPKNMVIDGMHMELADQVELKKWLQESGWKPTMWNTKRDENGKEVKTSPKLQEAGVICPNLLAMNTGIIKDITTWMSLRNRLGVIKGWLSHPRLAYDGRLPAGSSGLAATHRNKHRVVVNVPSANALLGKEMRELFTSEEGMLIAAADASGLELRMQGHYTYRFDNGETADILLNGDAHSLNAKKMFPKETEGFDIDAPDFDKDHPDFKPWRSKAKSINYCLLYGGGAATAAKTAGIPVNKGTQLVESYWRANQATKAFKDTAERWYELAGLSKYIVGIDKKLLHIRSRHAIVNTLFQSAGATVMDMACCFMDAWLGDIHYDNLHRPHYIYKGKRVYRIGYLHDEIEHLCEAAVADEVKDMTVKAIVKAGKYFKLKVPLAGDGAVGKNWFDVH